MRSATKGLIAGGMTFAAFAAGGAALGNEMYYDNVVPVKEAAENEADYSQAELDEIRDEQVDLDYDRDAIEESLGESCLRLVRLYMPDGGLADTEEDVIVSDLLGEPGQPCGDSPAEIRNDVRSLLSAEAAITENEALYTETSNGDSNGNQGSDINVPGTPDSQAGNIALGVLLGSSVGLLAGSLAGMVTTDYSLDRPRGRRY